MAFALPYFEELIFILGLITIGSICGLIGGVFLLWKEAFVQKYIHFLISFAAGVLLAAAFLDLLPHAIEETPYAWLACLAGLVIFTISERSLVWHLHHKNHIRAHLSEVKILGRKATGLLLMLGDTIHNFIDGMMIAAATLTFIPLGILTAIATFFHEIPQEIGDFSVLIYAKYPKKKVFSYNFLSALAAFGGGLLVFFGISLHEFNLSPLIAFGAGGFIYIAATDLLPELKHEAQSIAVVAKHTTFLLLGMALIYALTHLLHVH